MRTSDNRLTVTYKQEEDYKIIVTEARPDENVRQQANCYLQAGRGLYDNCDVNRARRERETAG